MNQPAPLWNSLEIAKLFVSVLTPLLLLFLPLPVLESVKVAYSATSRNGRIQSTPPRL